ncbi:MAG: fatty acid hydroxylase family protein, partial [Pseudomonadota bacterium]
MKQAIFDHLPPATVIGIWAVFGLAPASLLEQGWLFPLVAFGTMAFIQLMEFVHERHEGWRITGKEFATDFFYMLLVIFVIGALVEMSVDGPLAQAKEALGIGTPWIMELPYLVQVLMIMLIF